AAVALDEARDRDAASLDLPRRDPAALGGLEAVVPESDVAAGPGRAAHAPALLLAVLDLLGHQHGVSPLRERSSGPRGVGLAPVDPGLDADLAEGGVGLVKARVHVRPQGVQRQLAVQVPLRE